MAFPAGEHAAWREAPIAGLAGRPKSIPGKFLWDEAGSRIFDRICDDPDYHPMRCESALLPEAVREVAARIGPGATVVEYGSGASRKIRTLLDGLDRPARYVAIDISRDYLEASVRSLAADYPDVAMIPVSADYAGPIRLPIDLAKGPILGFFPGTSIGNVSPAEAEALLGRMRDTLGPSRLLIGVDPTMDEARLRTAYGRCSGLMPAFHLNLLTRMNRELGADFDPEGFRHEVRILHDPFRVEAHLVAARAQTYRCAGTDVAFEAGESLRTDLSHKYGPDAFRALAGRGGWGGERCWLDPDGLFSLHLLAG